MFQFELDVHTHTTASGHAYSTLGEMVSAASRQGLKILGVTEHAEGVPGTCSYLYFSNYGVVPRHYENVRLLLGVELNILDYEGTLSMPERLMNQMELRIAGIHKFCYVPGTKEQNTNAVVNAMKSGWVDIVSHPDDGSVPLDYDIVTDMAKEYDVLLELNNNSLAHPHARPNVRENNLEMLGLCKKKGVKILVSSDAHHESQVGIVDNCLPLLEEASFPLELIVNTNAEAFMGHLEKKHAGIKLPNEYPHSNERQVEK
ncbi:MAG TPA: phosphatase [Erysipelotrichaceae bacterium]|nr:phosphatase [Erysipelotrichaceae bacterium]